MATDDAVTDSTRAEIDTPGRRRLPSMGAIQDRLHPRRGAPAAAVDEPAGDEDDAVAYATEFIKHLVRLKGVRIDRAHYLRAELRKGDVPERAIDAAIADRPATAGIPAETLDEIARATIELETRKSSAMSFAAGLPGGFGLIASVPGDITQYYVHAFRIMQKLAYLYGWQSFIDDCEDVDDETLAMLGAFLGVMLGVGGASNAVSAFARQVAQPALQKQIAGKALTKTAWYPVVKQTLKLVGVKVTKDSLAKTVTKAVPVIGGVVGGGMTYGSLKIQSTRLRDHLRGLPPARVVDRSTPDAVVVSTTE